MRKTLCKIWNFILNLFTDVVDAVAYGLKTFGEVLVPVLGALGQVVGDTIGSIFGGSNLLVWGVAGFFLLSFLKQRDKTDLEREKIRTVYDETQPKLVTPSGGMTA